MEADFKIIFKIGNWFLAERCDLLSEPKYKHLYYFIGKHKGTCYWEIINLNF